MVCVAFSLILAGCMLSKQHIKLFVLFNIVLFMILSYFFSMGYVDLLGYTSPLWYINTLTTQVAGVILLAFMNTMFGGLEHQTNIIKESYLLQRASEIKYRSMMANISEVILIVDDSGYVTYHSMNIHKLFVGLSDDVLNQKFYEVFPIEHGDDICQQNLKGNEGMTLSFEEAYKRFDGSVGYLEFTATYLGADPYINGILINLHDITDRKRKEAEIKHLSFYDSLTGLYNRAYFEEKKLELDHQEYYPISIITGDINGLKLINDTLGHIEGDKLLRTIGEILKTSCRADDIIARFGGDEFNIMLPRTSNEVALQIVDRIYERCEVYNKNEPSELNWISISLGAATKKSKKESFDHIYKIAENNMYRRKLLESRSLHSSIISSMRTLLFEKSQETQEHAQRLNALTREIGRVIGLTKQQFEELDLFSTLHDIGKIGIEDQILNKRGRLTEDEWVTMKKHTEIGYRIAMVSPELIPIADYILTHHERWDGTGYPQGLAGEDIPLLSRILAVADSYDAMVEDRPYRKGMSKQAAIEEIRNNLGTQYDHVIGQIFINIINH
jgi:diguanylate cyclase (GGDEF)-like protein/PAS domain S-box-containing protein